MTTSGPPKLIRSYSRQLQIGEYIEQYSFGVLVLVCMSKDAPSIIENGELHT